MKNIIASFLLSLFGVMSCRHEKPEQPKPAPTPTLTQGQKITGSAMMVEAKEKLYNAKAKLTQEDKYNCCLKEPCNMCALEDGECDCYKDLKTGKSVCVECYAGWQQGNGADENIKKEHVTTDVVKHEHHQ